MKFSSITILALAATAVATPITTPADSSSVELEGRGAISYVASRVNANCEKLGQHPIIRKVLAPIWVPCKSYMRVYQDVQKQKIPPYQKRSTMSEAADMVQDLRDLCKAGAPSDMEAQLKAPFAAVCAAMA